MWKLIILVFYFLCTGIYGQATFNKQYFFNSYTAVGNGIHATDSCYYFSGIIVDTLPPYRDGVVFGNMDLNGEIIGFTYILDTMKTYLNWYTPLVYNQYEGAFISMGSGVDSMGLYNYWMKINANGVREAHTYYRNRYFPGYKSTRVNDYIWLSENNSYYALSESSIWENNIGLTPGYKSTVTKLSALGDSIRGYTFVHDWNHQPQSILFHNNEVICGVLEGNYNITSINKQYRTRIFAIDTSCQFRWTWTSPQNNQQGANDMVATPDSGLVVASGRGYLEYVNVGTRIMLWDRGLIFKLNANRQVVWEREFKEPRPTEFTKLNKIVSASDGSGYVAAGRMVVSVDGHSSLFGWLAKVSPEGDSLWSRKLLYYDIQGDSIGYWHEINDLQATSDGGYLMSGQTNDMNGSTFPRQRAWFIKVGADGCLVPGCGLVDATGPTPKEAPALLLYPNPATDMLNIHIGATDSPRWRGTLVNAAGQVVAQYNFSSSQTTYIISVAHLPAGMYYLRLTDVNGRVGKTYPWVKG